MKKYKVWTHIDTGVCQVIKAGSENEASVKAKRNLECKNFKKQIEDNLQTGETYVME